MYAGRNIFHISSCLQKKSVQEVLYLVFSGITVDIQCIIRRIKNMSLLKKI